MKTAQAMRNSFQNVFIAACIESRWVCPGYYEKTMPGSVKLKKST
jgi:hypothetical protein